MFAYLTLETLVAITWVTAADSGQIPKLLKFWALSRSAVTELLLVFDQRIIV